MNLQGLFAKHLDLPGPDKPLDRRVLPAGGGVCALTDQQGRLVQTLGAQDLRRVLARRLQTPGESPGRRQVDLRAIARHLWWQPTHSVFETSLTYLRVARRLAPDRYRKELSFGPVWFARVNPEDRFPRWSSDKFALTPPTIDVGPFRDRGGCRGFIELLEDLFDLCRYHEVLRQAPGGVACAYKEMGRCPAPCDGSVSMEHYRGQIAASVEFARGRTDTRLSQLEGDMTGAAGRREFERAGRIREQIARARKTLATDKRLCLTPDEFRYLVIQRGCGTTRIKPFFVDGEQVRAGEAVSLKKIEHAAEQWTDKTRQRDAGTVDADPIWGSECIWLVSHFLVKGDRAPGLFVHESELAEPAELARKVTERFGKTLQKRCSESGSVDPLLAAPLE